MIFKVSLENKFIIHKKYIKGHANNKKQYFFLSIDSSLIKQKVAIVK